MSVNVPMYVPKKLSEVTNPLVDSLHQFIDKTSENLVLHGKIEKIPEKIFRKACNRLSKYTLWDRVEAWKEEIRYTYNTSETTQDVTVVRDTNVKTTTETQCTNTAEYQTQGIGTILVNAYITNVFKERKMDQCVLPSKVKVLFTREYCSRGWRFVLSKSWSSTTLKSTFAKMDNSPPNNSLEVILDPCMQYLRQHSSPYVALSLIMKMFDALASNVSSLKI